MSESLFVLEAWSTHSDNWNRVEQASGRIATPAEIRAAAEAAGFLVVDREEAEKKRQDFECWTCDGIGEVVHDIDCDGCARGEDHSEPCPDCDGRGEITMVPLADLVPVDVEEAE